MSMERCSLCDRIVDTDKDVEGDYIKLRYVCRFCLEKMDAEEELFQQRMREIGR